MALNKVTATIKLTFTSGPFGYFTNFFPTANDYAAYLPATNVIIKLLKKDILRNIKNINMKMLGTLVTNVNIKLQHVDSVHLKNYVESIHEGRCSLSLQSM